MSKNRKYWLYWTAQLVGWAIFYVLIFGLNIAVGLIKPDTTFLILSIQSFLLSILVTHFIIRTTILKLKWLTLNVWGIVWRSFLLAISAAFFYEVIDRAITSQFEINFYTNPKDGEYTLSKFFGSVFLYAILFSLWMSFYYTFLFIEKSRKQEIKNLQFEAKKNEIELKNLRAQINPHFLFNALNSIKALIEIDKDEAKEAITKLSNLLRQSITLSKSKLISIKEELNVVQTYINIEKIRFEERIKANFDIDEAVLNCKIPPLMIQTLVENAIKHGLSKMIDGGIINVIIKKEKDRVKILIENSGQLKYDKNKIGIGIENTKKRLKILFGKSAKFRIYQCDEMVCSEIVFKCVE
jgi:sensor histidine kinase YesM